MARGRILARTLPTSKRMLKAVNSSGDLCEFVPLLYSWIIPQTDDFGHFDADPLIVKSRVMPLSNRSVEEFQKAIDILESFGLLMLYNDRQHLEIVDFNKFQTFRSDRTRQQEYPMPQDDNECHTSDIPRCDVREVKLREEKVRKDICQQQAVDDSPVPLKQNKKPCPHTEIINLYHEKLPELASISTKVVGGKEQYNWTGARASHLKSRWAESERRQTLEWWTDFFGFVKESDFLMGKTNGTNGRSFKADLGWLIKPENFNKVVEGKYTK
jgi:hypothetical protein